MTRGRLREGRVPVPAAVGNACAILGVVGLPIGEQLPRIC